MSTPEQQVRDLLLPTVSGGVFFDAADIGTPAPFIVVNEIGGRGINFLESTQPSKRQITFEINVFATSRLEAATISRQIEVLLRTQLKAYVEAESVSGYDESTNLSGTRQDFSIWFDS